MRSSGILMHISSLPGPHGVGTMGKPAYAFVDFLKQAGQSYWQILPLTPTGYGDSPYQSCSSFAGNPYLIDLELLVQQGLLQPNETESICWYHDPQKVDFGIQYRNRLQVLRLACGRFVETEDYRAFCMENSSWLPDYSLFMALKGQNEGKSWYQWEEPLKQRQPDAIWQARQTLKEEIRFYCFVQYVFYSQWTGLKNYCRKNGVKIIGDVPIYVPLDSVEVWCNPDLFQLDDQRNPTVVAGCPPDGFSADGQLWGNPIYRWEQHEKDGYSWWLNRLASAGKLYDVVRIDHFRGFESYWAVPYGDTTAKNGKWCKGPGLAFLKTAQEKLPELEMIAEDLGFLTPEVLQMRDGSGLPGMKVLEFAFDSKEPSEYLPHTYPSNSVCYIGTHDNMTLCQWLETAGKEELDYATEYMHLTRDEGLAWGVIRTAMASVSDLCVIQMQDYLELGGEARMNFPGTMTDKNWTWRAREDFASPALAERICRMTRLYGRNNMKSAAEETALSVEMEN